MEVPSRIADDNQLVVAALAGDETAFEQLFLRHKLMVARIGGHFFRQPEQVEDILQSSFASAYFSLKDFQGGGEAAFKAWLSRITVNTCYDALRYKRCRPEDTISAITDDESRWLDERMTDQSVGGDAEQAVVARDLSDKLLARLEADDRLVLTLLHAAELSVKEVSEITGWSGSKVKIKAYRARIALRRIMRKFL